MKTNLVDKLGFLEQLSIAMQHDERMGIAKKKASASNPFFVEEFVELAIQGICKFLQKEPLQNWVSQYPFLNTIYPSQKIALIMAGNIPLVGFHDFLCVYLTDHSIQIKTSSKDDLLLKAMLELLYEIDKNAATRITILERLTDFDAVIATGSDNSFRYFEYYFKNKPSLLRKNRNSVAILEGNETDEELQLLADDIFLYFGLGCRNISKLYVSQDFQLERLFPNFSKYNWMHHHSKYMNNYDYHRAIFLLNGDNHLADEKVMIIEKEQLTSSLAVLHFERYKDLASLKAKIEDQKNDIQCIVASKKVNDLMGDTRLVSLGSSQFPELDDYADNIDTLLFLESLNDSLTLISNKN